nr:trafficking protein particle complex subunit 9 [Ciona intestinalis]|eukprot:XP_002125742.1 trafficking protein particle complex subunit 9 [Ciona intestinalis]
MSIANYNVSCKQHSQILICVQSHGNISHTDFEEALSRIKKHEHLTVADAGRKINVRFEVDVPANNSEWGFFQPHRRVMGFIMIAGCSTAMDVALLHEVFQKKKETLADFIFDARCFVFGMENSLIQQRNAAMLQYPDVKTWKTCDIDIEEFLTSVFYVLESKRLHIVGDKSDKLPLLTAPFERQQVSSYDSDSRSYRKKCAGRWKKHLADISLLSGLTLDALQNYHSALDMLVSVNDQVWVGGALEGLCVTSAIVWYSDEDHNQSEAANLASSKQALDPRNLVSSKIWNSATMANLLKYCIQTPEDFVDRYKEAVINYSRCKHLGVVELEACIKATKVMAIMKKSMEASEFLQNAVYITLNVTEEERITRYSIVADLYRAINFHRKSAFYKRVAAMQCVAPNLNKPNWQKCYQLLQHSLKGYHLNVLGDENKSSLDTELSDQVKYGWPQVRLRVLHELVFSSRRLGKNKMAVRYMLYLLMHMHQHLLETEEKEICAGLESFAGKSTLHEQSDSDDDIHMLFNLPQVLEIVPKQLSFFAQPTILQAEQSTDSVFLFTPSTYQSLKRVEQHIDFKWCVNTPAEIQLQIHNPLHHHTLHVSELRLICESSSEDEKEVNFIESHQVSLDISPNSTIQATLVVVPKKNGTIKIKGYESVVFGVRSQCLFSDMNWIPINLFEVEVTPALPMLQREISDYNLNSDENKCEIEVHLYPGEIKTLCIPYTNISEVNLDEIEIFLSQPVDTNKHNISSVVTTSTKAERKCNWLKLKFNKEELNSQLPLLPQKSIQIPFQIEATNVVTSETFDLKACSSEVQIKYSCLEALEKNWCRMVSVKLVVVLHPCLLITNLNISSATRQLNYITTMQVENICDDVVRVTSCKLNCDNVVKPTHLTGIENGHIVIVDLDANDKKKLKFQIPTSTLCSAILENKFDPLSITSNISNDDFIRDKFNKAMSLEWRTGSGAKLRRGKINISLCEFNLTSFVNVVTSPIYWEFLVNDIIITESGKCSVAIGEPCPVTIQLKNITEHTISKLDLELEIFQDQENGFREWNMEDCVVCMGCQGQYFEQVAPGSSIDFEIVLVFLLVGQYNVRLKRMSANYDGISDKCGGELKRTMSNQSNPEVLSYREFSPKVVFTAVQK